MSVYVDAPIWHFRSCGFRYARKIRKPDVDIKLTLTINGEERPLSDLSEEILLNIRNESPEKIQ